MTTRYSRTGRPRHWIPTYRVRPKAIDMPGIWPAALEHEAERLRKCVVPDEDFHQAGAFGTRWNGGMSIEGYRDARATALANVAARRGERAA